MKRTRFCALCFLTLCTIFIADIQSLSAQNAQDPKLLLTVACLSDLHGQGSIINGSNADLRTSVDKAVAYLKANEQMDVILLGGDFTSQTKISQTQWENERTLIANTMRSVFNGRTPTPVLYCNGNHEYQAPYYTSTSQTFSPSSSNHMAYNSGDYYSFPMMTDVGELSSDDCFYEDADNGGGQKMKLLAAYHYVIKGFDFIVLNTGKYLFTSKDNLYYSAESAQWVANKLDAIYTADPNKTVFFVAHIPFGDSNSIIEASKGMNTSQPGTTILKQALASHPNVIMLYGHDHKADKAYIKDKTSQRVTRYDTNGNVISSFDADHVDGTVQGVTPGEGGGEGSGSSSIIGYYLKNLGNSKYIGVDATDINIFTDPQLIQIQNVGSDNLIRTLMTYNGTTYNLHCGTNGYYSKDSQKTSTANNENEYWYEVADPSASTINATKVKDFAKIQLGKSYIIIGYNKSSGTKGFYALGNSLASGTNQRVASKIISTNKTLDDALSYNRSDIINYIYTLEEAADTPSSPTSSVTPSFVSSFMGSMRYYSNAVTTGSGDAEENPIVQGLMIYVYENRIELRMKNFGTVEADGTVRGTSASGKSTGSVKLTNPPTPYTIFRAVSTEQVDPVEPQPEASHVFVKATGSTSYEESPLSEEGDLTIVDVCDGFKVDQATEVASLTYSRSFNSYHTWEAWYMPFDMTLTAALLNDYSFAKLAGAMTDEDGNLYMSFVRMKAGDVVKANTPYLVKAPKADGTIPQTITLTDVTLQPTAARSINAMTTEDVYTFSGFYDRKYASPDDKAWYALSKSKGSFVHPTSTASVGPFRYVMDVTPREDNPYGLSSSPASVKVRVMGEEDVLERIEEVYDFGNQSTPFTIQGTKVSGSFKGIVVLGGNKILKK